MSNAESVPFETTIRVRDTCLCLHLQRAARAVGRRFDAVLRPLGLTNGQFSLLMSLNRPEPAGIGGVAALLAMDRTTLTAALKPLEHRGLLEVTVDAEDKRGRRLRLTAAGRALLAAAVPAWAETHAAIEARLPRSNPDGLRGDLRALSRDGKALPLQPSAASTLGSR
jgi:DNA-binding MarR family transcriptional regulator